MTPSGPGWSECTARVTRIAALAVASSFSGLAPFLAELIPGPIGGRKILFSEIALLNTEAEAELVGRRWESLLSGCQECPALLCDIVASRAEAIGQAVLAEAIDGRVDRLALKASPVREITDRQRTVNAESPEHAEAEGSHHGSCRHRGSGCHARTGRPRWSRCREA